MNSFFEELFQYNFAMNQRLISALKEQAGNLNKCTRIISHIVNGHQVWNSRITGNMPLGVWDERDLGENLLVDENNFSATISILKTYPPKELIHYVNSAKLHFSNTIQDILFQILNHSTHHRAQVFVHLKEQQIPVFPIDFIFYIR